MESFRKAYGALKDSTKVGLAKVNSDFKDLDIAIVKATNHVECPPKERHVRKIFAAVALSSPRADVGYCIHALSKRLSKTRSWIVAIKSLIVFHRILREGDTSFREELEHISRRGHIFQISNFKDDSSALAWDCSAWIRSYAVFLEERLECFRNLNFDIDSSEKDKEHYKNRELNIEQLLEQLPALQHLLYRLICCQPEGASRYNYLVQYALALVVKESFKVYCTINDGIIILVDTYFDMPQQKAVAALNIYKKAGRQADHLADFYDFCKTLDLARTFQFPILRQPPSSFVATMEDYIKEAPENVSPSHRMEQQRRKDKAHKNEELSSKENEKRGQQVGNKTVVVALEKPIPEVKQVEQHVDLLGLNETSPTTTKSEESNNSLALAICQPTENEHTSNNFTNASGWELALVTTPSNTNSPQTLQSKHNHQGGVFDTLLLDSLYDDDVSRRQLQLQRAGYNTDAYGYGTSPRNLFDQRDPFTTNITSPSTDARMMLMSPQQHMVMQQQQQQRYQMVMQQQQYQLMMQQHHQQQQQYQMMMQQQQYNKQHNMMIMMASHNQHSYTSQYPQQQQSQMQQMGSKNPFGDPFSYPQSSMPPHRNHT